MSTANTLEAPSTTAFSGKGVAGRYLTFGLGPESYGIPVIHVREIIRMPEVTAVPQMPSYVRGVLNLRGKIIPVIDLRRRFELAFDGLDERTCVVMVQITPATGGSLQMGLVVDCVEEVVTVHPEEIEPPPRFGSTLAADYLLGMAKIKGKVKTLLDIDKVVAADGLASIAAAA